MSLEFLLPKTQNICAREEESIRWKAEIRQLLLKLNKYLFPFYWIIPCSLFRWFWFWSFIPSTFYACFNIFLGLISLQTPNSWDKEINTQWNLSIHIQFGYSDYHCLPSLLPLSLSCGFFVMISLYFLQLFSCPILFLLNWVLRRLQWIDSCWPIIWTLIQFSFINLLS